VSPYVRTVKTSSGTTTPGGPLPVTASRMGHLWDARAHGGRVLGFGQAAADEVFAQLVLARISEPASKLEAGP